MATLNTYIFSDGIRAYFEFDKRNHIVLKPCETLILKAKYEKLKTKELNITYRRWRSILNATKR